MSMLDAVYYVMTYLDHVLSLLSCNRLEKLPYLHSAKVRKQVASAPITDDFGNIRRLFAAPTLSSCRPRQFHYWAFFRRDRY